MRMLVAAALGVLAAVTGAGQRTETLYTRSSGTIAAFAQDGPLISWFEPGGKTCNRAVVLSLSNGIKQPLPLQGNAPNVTCHWATPAVGLALARTGNAVWTLRETAPLRFDYLVGASTSDPRERRFQEVAHTTRGAGLWLGGLAGDQSTLVYGVTTVDYEDEAGCLAGTGSCEMHITGGGLYRVVGRQQTRLVPRTGDAGVVAIAIAGRSVAYVRADSVGKNGWPFASSATPIEVVDIETGDSLAEITPQGTPAAIAMSTTVLAVLERSSIGVRLSWYDSRTGKSLGSVAVPVAVSPELSTTDRTAVFRVGRQIESVDLTTNRVRRLVRAATAPIGLSIEGGRIAWAENPGGRGRIRALYVGGRG